MNDASAMLLLLDTPGIRPSQIRALVQCHLKYRVSLADLLKDRSEASHLFTPDELQRLRLGEKNASANVTKLVENDIDIIPISDPQYPAVLRDRFGTNAPAVLFCRGAIGLLHAASVGFCGSRKASARGLEVAADCASQLSEANINVVSGYAAGIDVTTHSVALREGGTTTVVLPEGIEHFRIRRDLKDIWDWSRVLIISQFNPTMPWRVENAMKRNIIICALSRALIVVEAGRTGGSIEAGRVALAANIPVYAPVYDGMPETAAGNFELFVKGAKKILKSKSTERAKMKMLFEQVAAPPERSLFETLYEG